MRSWIYGYCSKLCYWWYPDFLEPRSRNVGLSSNEKKSLCTGLRSILLNRCEEQAFLVYHTGNEGSGALKLKLALHTMKSVQKMGCAVLFGRLKNTSVEWLKHNRLA